MRLRFTKLGTAYFALMLFAVAGTLYATIRIYTDAGRDLPDVYSACLGHTAAVMGIFAIIGAGDMFFRFEESKELQEERRKREADLQKAAAASDARLERALAGMREEREFHQALREQEWAQREQERAEERIRREDERARWEQERAEEQSRWEQEQIRRDQERAEERARWEQEQALREREQTQREQERAQNQQLLANLMAQNLEMNNRLLNMLERRNGHANGNGASEPA